jgi:dihydroneopterin aldolase
MMQQYKISVGVEELIIDLESCTYDENQKAQLLVSFQVEGDFRLAAKNDDLSQTVDYDALSRRIGHSLKGLNCSQIEEINARLEKTLKGFSPLISGALIESRLSCHAAFINHRSLL